MSAYEQAIEVNRQAAAARDERRPPRLKILNTSQESDTLRASIGKLAAAHGELSILEAGCGNSWQLQLPGVRYVLTGVDLNADALEIRKTQRRDLDIAIQGDLRSVELDEHSYDVVYNSFVLEHVEGAELVLENFYRWLRPGGILILRIPDPRSVYGMLSRITPFWFHVFYKRYVAGMKTAGKPGYDPFPVVYDPIVCRRGIRRWCAERGMILREELGWNYRIGRPGLMSLAVNAATRAISLLSVGRLSANHVNLTYVIEKPAVAQSAR